MQPENTGIPLSYKLLAWFDVHKKQTITGAALVLFLAIIISFVYYLQGQKISEASVGFSKLMFNQTETPEPYLQFAAKYPNAGGGANALMQGALALFISGKYSEAQVQFEKFRSTYRNNPMYGTASLGIAASLDAQRRADEALPLYEALIANPPSDMVLIQSQFAAARLYEAKKDFQKAIKLYEVVGTEDREGRMGQDASVRAHELGILHPLPAASTVDTSLIPSTIK